MTPNTLIRALMAAATVVAVSGCSSTASSVVEKMAHVITPYRPEVVQGNVVTREQLAQVQVGMDRNRVRDILGSPMLTDVFHAQRWDYVFLIRRQGTEPQSRSIVVLFEGDKVSAIQAPELPSEREFVSSISRNKPSEKERKLELTPEERAALPVPPKPEVSSQPVPQGANRTYPPLEAS